eukprot:3988397-Lingulodinium_polyedra.AAC.1
MRARRLAHTLCSILDTDLALPKCWFVWTALRCKLGPALDYDARVLSYQASSWCCERLEGLLSMVCAKLLQVNVLGVQLRQRAALRVTQGGLGLAIPGRRAPALRL